MGWGRGEQQSAFGKGAWCAPLYPLTVRTSDLQYPIGNWKDYFQYSLIFDPVFTALFCLKSPCLSACLPTYNPYSDHSNLLILSALLTPRFTWGSLTSLSLWLHLSVRFLSSQGRAFFPSKLWLQLRLCKIQPDLIWSPQSSSHQQKDWQVEEDRSHILKHAMERFSSWILVKIPDCIKHS